MPSVTASEAKQSLGLRGDCFVARTLLAMTHACHFDERSEEKSYRSQYIDFSIADTPSK